MAAEVFRSRFKRAVLWLALAVIVLGIFTSVYGAFMGAERAKRFFNSLPLGAYWTAFGAVLIAGIVVFGTLLGVRSLLLIHLGCVLIIGGAMWGSERGHQIRAGIGGVEKISAGEMVIFEGEVQNTVRVGEGQFRALPFSLRLADFRLEHYEPAYLYIEDRQGRRWKAPVEVGSDYSLGGEFGKVRIVRAFENFKIRFEQGQRIITDDPEPGYNPAVEVQIEYPDGQTETKYVFERFPGHTHKEDRLVFAYRRVIRDYVSDIEVVRNGEVVAKKQIEVNHPLRYGGYHFYQHEYDSEGGRYSVLEVVSDSGLKVVYTGYLMVCAGVVWRLWLREVTRGKRKTQS